MEGITCRYSFVFVMLTITNMVLLRLRPNYVTLKKEFLALSIQKVTSVRSKWSFCAFLVPFATALFNGCLRLFYTLMMDLGIGPKRS